MFALRYFARSLPRAALRVSKPVAPRTVPFLALKPQPSLRAFSTTIWRREAAGESDQLLSAKLVHEFKLELENQNDELRTSIDDFLSNSPFEIEDKTGTHNVFLKRQFGNEAIKVEFSVIDLDNAQEDFDSLEEDPAFGDEDVTDPTSGGRRTINQTKGGKIDVAPEDSLAPSDRDEPYDDQPSDQQYALNLTITITKGGKGATVIQAEAQNGAIDISRMTYYPKAELADPKTPEDMNESDAVYGGPPFASLDAELQAMVYQYLEERGINAELAEFLPQYIEYKEQNEYVGLLENFQKFVDA